jgi:hypothetical protein
MPRPKNPFPGIRSQILIPEDVRARLSLALYSPAEQRVPYGAYSSLVTQLLRDWLDARDQIINAAKESPT